MPVRVIDPEYQVKMFSDGFGSRSHTVPLCDESGIEFLARTIKERIDNKRDCPILLTGDPGIGKSTVGIKLARKIDSDFKLDNIAFRIEDFGRIFNENAFGGGSKYPQILLDEAGHALFGQQWMDREQQEVAKMLIIGRIKRQIIYMAVPRPGQLNSQARDRPFMWIHVFEPHEYEQGAAKVYLAPPELQSEFYVSKYWECKLVFTFKELEGQFWDNYEQRKIQFVQEITAQTASGAGKYDRYVRLIRHMIETQGYSQTKIAEIMGCDKSWITLMLKKVLPKGDNNIGGGSTINAQPIINEGVTVTPLQ